ncbi:mitochondrial large ribosomal subunit [Moniliophthora roreri MCA 2997]|uniref:Large ribosomal subunit protein mL49 n=1 Tax=Moniliophthora roreri (strain MCA 2997) TaxID=1381753 RepID=V2XYE1_MONRO|nr:mitochondrial large ribosomal subunit [Moniliophthora roreri MCA 2997]
MASPTTASIQPLKQLPYLIRRNANSNLPVYTDIRNAGTRHLLNVRNVEGDIDALARDISSSLFPANTSEATKMRIHTIRSRHLVIQGGRWKNEVMDWLQKRGF